jgi:tetratricopeptide (TPR) repeat protein
VKMKTMPVISSEPGNSRAALHGACWAALWLSLFLPGHLQAADDSDWLVRVREQVAAHDLSGAAATVSARLAIQPSDLEASTWRARILSWTGHLPEAEALYRQIEQQAPNDADVAIGLADVLFWEGKVNESSAVLERAERLRPASLEIEQRRRRNQQAIQDQHSSRNSVAPAWAAESDLYRYSLRLGSETDLFTYSSAAQTQVVEFGVRWNSRWSSRLLATSYRRFSESAGQWGTAVSYRISADQSLAASFAAANHQQIAPVRQFAFDYDHGTRLHAGALKGMEFVAHSASIWFDGAAVTVLGGSAIGYLSRDWMCTFSGNAARTRFTNAGASWAPALFLKLSLPALSRLRADIGAGTGAENYSNQDQIGQISARTYAGGVHYSLSRAQEISASAAYQQRSHGAIEVDTGVGYELRF